MTVENSAERRRELQRRAFAPGGSLTAAEADELRMLTAPTPTNLPSATPTHTSASPTAPTRTDLPPTGNQRTDPPPTGNQRTDPPPTHLPRTAQPGDEADLHSTAQVQDGAAAPGQNARRPRWITALACLAALAVGMGVGWATAPRTADAAPAMSDAQRRIAAELEASGDFDAGSVRFAGEEHDAAVWTARLGEEHCLIMRLDDRQESACGDPEADGMGGQPPPYAQIQTTQGRTTTTVTAVLRATLSGRSTVVVESWAMDLDEDSWQFRYSDTEIPLVEELQKAGFAAPLLRIVGYDGALPIWTIDSDRRCLMIVDPASLEVSSSCADGRSQPQDDWFLEHSFAGNTYQVSSTMRSGPILTIVRGAASDSTSCDTCTTIDDTTGEVG